MVIITIHGYAHSASLFKDLTHQNLSWLKQIITSHGSVSINTQIQVHTINSSGIYYIADSERTKDIKNVNAGAKLCLENLVCLVVPKDRDKNLEEKTYSFEEVKDIQSKLMLIGRKAEREKQIADQFNEVGISKHRKFYIGDAFEH